MRQGGRPHSVVAQVRLPGRYSGCTNRLDRGRSNGRVSLTRPTVTEPSRAQNSSIDSRTLCGVRRHEGTHTWRERISHSSRPARLRADQNSGEAGWPTFDPKKEWSDE